MPDEGGKVEEVSDYVVVAYRDAEKVDSTIIREVTKNIASSTAQDWALTNHYTDWSLHHIA